MSETPMKLVVDCSLPDKTRELAAMQRGVEATFELIRQGKLTREEGQDRVQAMLDYSVEVTAAPEREQVVPLDEADLAQRELDATEAIAGAWRNLRAQRDARLRACDWTQVRDATLTAEQATAWATYRQQLRDLPAGTKDPLNPVWPVPPA